MPSLTYRYLYGHFEVTIVGYEFAGGWRMAVEIKSDNYSEIYREPYIYPDFNSLKSKGIWEANFIINKRQAAEAAQADAARKDAPDDTP